MPQFMQSQPMFQREMQKAEAKASMSGQRPQTEAIKTALHMQDLERKNQFGQLSRAKKRHKMSMKGQKFDLKQQNKSLKEREKQLPWQIGIGVGTSLLSALEGRRRAQLIAQRDALKEARWNDMMSRFGGTKRLPNIPGQ